jgi:RNase P subunit RPR2
MKMAFCERCHDVLDYNIKEEKMSSKVMGKEISYIGKRAFCSICGNEVFVNELLDYNLEQLNNEYSRYKGL